MTQLLPLSALVTAFLQRISASSVWPNVGYWGEFPVAIASPKNRNACSDANCWSLSQVLVEANCTSYNVYNSPWFV